MPSFVSVVATIIAFAAAFVAFMQWRTTLQKVAVVASVGPLTMELPPCQAWAVRKRAAVVIDRGTGVKPLAECEISHWWLHYWVV